MKEIKGDLFAYDGRKGFNILITTNGFIKNDGTAVMGRGNALQAKELHPELPTLLGKSLKVRKNNVSRLLPHLLSFPVKHNWFDKADRDLIKRSAKQLCELAISHPKEKFILPRPGCGNGQLKWRHVKLLLEKVKLPDNVWIITNEEE